ncbi:hypothetical protein K7Z75_11065 [Mycobacterium avium subsp. hominissuis]|uniref:hypothetical protein n=1 Tax=Mycobacterium avium TaxID=1764 RepID=UPI00079FECFE|nr:hypothetical protein [Mycobacterium avium]MDV3304230.1 hypothetical protein [Mycobacterium avium subsp. hominissuis]
MTGIERIPADDVNMGEWLNAVLAVSGTEWDSPLLPTDARVAFALANGRNEVGPFTGPGCTNTGYHCDDCKCLPALTPTHFDNSVQELIDAGFLSDVLHLDMDHERQEHVLRFRIPGGAAR